MGLEKGRSTHPKPKKEIKEQKPKYKKLRKTEIKVFVVIISFILHLRIALKTARRKNT
jgi:hypothetical protein